MKEPVICPDALLVRVTEALDAAREDLHRHLILLEDEEDDHSSGTPQTRRMLYRKWKARLIENERLIVAICKRQAAAPRQRRTALDG